MKLVIYSKIEPFFFGRWEEKVGILENMFSPSSGSKQGGYNNDGMHACMDAPTDIQANI